MIITMNAANDEQIQRVLRKLIDSGLEGHVTQNGEQTIITVTGDVACDLGWFSRLPGVDRVIAVATPFKLVSRSFKKHNTVVRAGNVVFGGMSVPIIAGPCAVEGYEQFLSAATAVKKAGAVMLRGGAFKPRTSPYSFQGLENKGLEILKSVAHKLNMPVVTEVVDPRSVEPISQYVDMLQIGTRNMQNYALLKEVALTNKPVMLKRGLSATIEEWLMAAEYIAVGGNQNIILCERGIRTFETYTRNTLDLNAVALVKELSHLPVIVDPSHGTGDWRLVGAMAKASVAAGADGLMIEVHPKPEEAMSDGGQSLTPQNFGDLMSSLRTLGEAVGRTVVSYN